MPRGTLAFVFYGLTVLIGATVLFAEMKSPRTQDARKVADAIITLFVTSKIAANSQKVSGENPGCEQLTAQQCLNLALDAIGRRERLQELRSVRFQFNGHTLLMEQSNRQEPFITSYERGTTRLDLTNQRSVSETHLTWPESEENQPEVTTIAVVGPEGGVMRGQEKDGPCALFGIDDARYLLALGPYRVLLTGAATSDLRFERQKSSAPLHTPCWRCNGNACQYGCC